MKRVKVTSARIGRIPQRCLTSNLFFMYVEASSNVEGEMLIKGPMNAVGYYKRPDLTAKAFDNEGYYHTV